MKIEIIWINCIEELFSNKLILKDEILKNTKVYISENNFLKIIISKKYLIKILEEKILEIKFFLEKKLINLKINSIFLNDKKIELEFSRNNFLLPNNVNVEDHSNIFKKSFKNNDKYFKKEKSLEIDFINLFKNEKFLILNFYNKLIFNSKDLKIETKSFNLLLNKEKSKKYVFLILPYFYFFIKYKKKKKQLKKTYLEILELEKMQFNPLDEKTKKIIEFINSIFIKK